MRLVHDPADGSPRTLATEVETADNFLTQGLGLMFRRSIPDGYALVFRFGRPATRRLHMLFVPFDIDAAWLVDGEVQRVESLSAWTGRGKGRADTVVEAPAGTFADVEPGDTLRVASGE